MKPDNFDNLLVQTYHEKIASSLVYVECANLDTGEVFGGTATVIAHTGNAEEGFIPYLATAGHLLPNQDVRTRIRLIRFSFENPANPTSRIAEFTLPREDSTPKTPAYIKITDKEERSRVDIGIIRAPATCTDGGAWFSTADPQAEAIPIVGASEWQAEGSEVAWAGFSGIAMQIANRPQPCYYHGVVSSLLIRDDFQLYLLDGHNTFGISGGPVWAVNAETKQPKLIAVIGGYQFSGQDKAMPGLVFATPIQVLLTAIFPDYVLKSSEL